MEETINKFRIDLETRKTNLLLKKKVLLIKKVIGTKPKMIALVTMLMTAFPNLQGDSSTLHITVVIHRTNSKI